MFVKHPPAFQFYPSDYLASARVQAMSLASQGAYIRLLCYQWQDGFISNQIPILARLCSISVSKMKKLWTQIEPCFELELAPGHLANKRLESVRNVQIEYRKRQAEFGKDGADKKKGTLKGTHKGKASSSSSSPSPSPSSSSTGDKKGIGKGDPPAAEKRAGKRDEAADLFASSYLKFVTNPYGWESGDFPQLMKLRKRLGIGTLDTPEDWESALLNYFASPFSEFSLKHFASKFDTFKNSRLDRFKVPENHVNGGNGNGSRKETDAEKNNRAVKDFINRSVAPAVRSDVQDVREDVGGLPGPLQRVP